MLLLVLPHAWQVSGGAAQLVRWPNASNQATRILQAFDFDSASRALCERLVTNASVPFMHSQ